MYRLDLVPSLARRRSRFLPLLQIDWFGAQAQNDWQWSDAHNLVVGVDYEKVEYESRSYKNTGERLAPFTPNNRKDTLGVYAENTFRFNDADTVLTLGGRYDYVD